MRLRDLREDQPLSLLDAAARTPTPFATGVLVDLLLEKDREKFRT